MNKARNIALTALDAFRDELAGRFIDLCRGNDGSKLTLLKIYDTIEEICNKHIEKWLDVGTVDIAPAPKWISVKDRMPDSGELCLLACKVACYNEKTYRYVCDGFHVDRWKEQEHNDGSGDQAIEYNEGDDEYYLCEGWYERIRNWDDYSSVVISDTVTHWMLLPEPPEEEGENT